MTLTLMAWAAMAFSIWYIPARLKHLLDLRRAWLYALLTAVVLGYMALLYSGIYVLDNITIAWIYNVLGLLFMFVFYLLFLLVLTLPLTALTRRSPAQLVGIGSLAVSAFFIAWGFINAQSFTVTRQDVAVAGLTQPVKIAHVPDIHLGAQRGKAWLGKVLAAVQAEKPDLVLYNGDLVDSNIALDPDLFALFKTVDAEQYFTTDNHEYYMDTDNALHLIADAGIHIVRSEMVETHGIQLIGMEYMNADRETWDAHVVNPLTL
ncbi:metallophosphoesterase [Pseudomonas sp. S75]|uniref:metallophosphoesterase n=1 Tax=unclassified Pseudomonas TaxID=196821 RepID=UPI001908EA43|nr:MULTISPECIES: metallophosphoesterase [unclassified Pseudomonas]MBJ9974158.1 metallophosphoesterase [Pseudomonas sp. S30]MBK0151912.1 metallophosphoesterase [Pseudomonas sp. S75]